MLVDADMGRIEPGKHDTIQTADSDMPTYDTYVPVASLELDQRNYNYRTRAKGEWLDPLRRTTHEKTYRLDS